MKIDDSSQLESSKAFYRGHRSPLTVLGIHAPKSMKINDNLRKSMKIDDSSQLESSKAF